MGHYREPNGYKRSLITFEVLFLHRAKAAEYLLSFKKRGSSIVTDVLLSDFSRRNSIWCQENRDLPCSFRHLVEHHVLFSCAIWGDWIVYTRRCTDHIWNFSLQCACACVSWSNLHQRTNNHTGHTCMASLQCVHACVFSNNSPEPKNNHIDHIWMASHLNGFECVSEGEKLVCRCSYIAYNRTVFLLNGSTCVLWGC